MDKETLFKLIRRQEVVLWAGSGLSRYAGYPMGPGTVRALHDALSTDLRQQLVAELGTTDPLRVPLPTFAELFLNLHHGNRFALNRVLIDVFGASPTDRHVHEQLAGIPYFEHIITTNYDNLFELTHQPLNTVYHSRKLPLRKVGQPTLYKIHGHLEDPDSIVISTSDYLSFFDRVDKLLWQQLEALMVSHTLLFIGYAVEDPNVLESFLKVHAALGDNMRPAYVVGPSMSPLKIATLAKRNVHFIQATGEEFVQELLEDIKKKSLLEMKRGQIGSDATGQLLSKQGLTYVIRKEPEGADCTELRRVEGQTTGLMQFSAQESSPLMQGLAKLTAGESLQVVKVVRDELTSLSMQVEGFEMPLGEEFDNLWIARTPTWHKRLAVRFASGLLLSDVRVKHYTSKNEAQYVAVDRYSRAVLTVPQHVEQATRVQTALATATEEELRAGRAIMNFEFQHTKRRPAFDSIESALRYADTKVHLGRGEAFEVLENWEPIWKQPQQPPIPTLLHGGTELRRLLLDLQKIEQCFGIRFQHFNYDALNQEVVHQLIQLIDRKKEADEHGVLSFQGPLDNFDEAQQLLLLGPEKEVEILLTLQAEPLTFDILGFALQLTFLENIEMRGVAVREVSAGLYEFSSRRTSRQLAEIIAAKVLASPPPVAPEAPTAEELLDDLLPEDLLPEGK